MHHHFSASIVSPIFPSQEAHQKISAPSGLVSTQTYTDTDLLLHRATGMPPDRMTPVRAQGTDQQHNRSAESSVNGTIVLLGNKAGPEYRRAASHGLQYTAQHNTCFVEVPEYIIVVSFILTKYKNHHTEVAGCQKTPHEQETQSEQIITHTFG